MKLQEKFSKVRQLEGDKQFCMVPINPLHNTMQQQQIVVSKLEGSITSSYNRTKPLKP
jgi:hypothetical protein